MTGWQFFGVLLMTAGAFDRNIWLFLFGAAVLFIAVVA